MCFREPKTLEKISLELQSQRCVVLPREELISPPLVPVKFSDEICKLGACPCILTSNTDPACAGSGPQNGQHEVEHSENDVGR